MLGEIQPLFVAPSLRYVTNKLYFWYFCTAMLGIGWKLKVHLPLSLSTIPRIHRTCRGFECQYFRNISTRLRNVFTFCVPTGLQILYVSYLAIMCSNSFYFNYRSESHGSLSHKSHSLSPVSLQNFKFFVFPSMSIHPHVDTFFLTVTFADKSPV